MAFLQKLRFCGNLFLHDEFADAELANLEPPDPYPSDYKVSDGKHTEGITPPKSNWALPIDTPPYSGFVVTCGKASAMMSKDWASGGLQTRAARNSAK
jgi:hypothetical protein